MSDQSDKVGPYDDKYTRRLRVPIEKWVRGNDCDLNMNNPEFVSLGVANELEEIRHPIVSLRPRPLMDQGRFAAFPCPDEGPSYSPLGSFYGYGEQRRNRDGLDGLTTLENSENDRAELLRKLDELKDQLSRSCDTEEKSKERLAGDRRMAPPPPDPHGGHNAFMPECSTNSYYVNMQPLARDKHVPKPAHFNHNHRPVPYVKNHALGVQELYHLPRNVPNEFLGYEDAYQSQMLRRSPHQHQPPRQYFPRTNHNHFPGQYMEFNQDSLASHPHETFFHHPACSCLRCYNQNWQIPPNIPLPVFSNRRSPNDPTYPIFYNHVNHATYGPPGYNSRCYVPRQLHSRDQHPQMRNSSDLDSENGGFGSHHSRRVAVGRGSGQVCHPIAGGAPFVTCCNCFELLKLPRKLLVMGRNQQTMRCGACSGLILFELEKKSIVFSVPAQIEQASTEVGDGSGETLNRNLQSSDVCLNADVTNSCCDNYENSGYNLQLTDTESNLLSSDQRLNFNEAERRQEPHFSTSSFSGDEQSPEGVMIVRRNISDSAELPAEDIVSLALPDPPLQDHPDCSSCENAVSSHGKGNSSKRTDQEKVNTDRTTSLQHYLGNAPVATEIEVSINDYSNSAVSQDSVEVIKEEDGSRINKGSESLFAGLIKKSFRSFSRLSQSMEDGRSNIFVNGQLIPNHVVKNAEKLAGPIQPGDYWYDFQAGFWGVMGHSCLGIIPPFIEEFNYPMPEKCGAGNTGVFVNGRELHQRDLDLLVSRGLPMMRNKSYVIEISGRVLDEDTGEELDTLGKLAPTVGRAKRGFGMKVPRALAK